jgi:DNA repair exonuclease SbcCD ATPase subunit
MLLINHIRLRAFTSTQKYGADIPLKRGLNIIQAHNTSGKSTALQSIIVALGLERSLGPQLAIPLPYAMRERIHSREGEPYSHVLQSYVEIEVENAEGTKLIIHRDIVGDSDQKLIRTWTDCRITDEKRVNQRDFYILDRGSAQNEHGFYFFLVNFIGWDLPVVPTFDGSECPLYLEAIFPMLFVEQKRGWSTTQGPFPTFLKIQDVARRVMEFLFDLDVGKFRRRRSELNAELSAILQKWNLVKSELNEKISYVGRIRGVPSLPSAEFALNPEISLEIYENENWLPITDVIKQRKNKIADLESRDLKTISEISSETESLIDQTYSEINKLSAQLEAIENELRNTNQEINDLIIRLSSLEDDLKRNQDAFKLQKLGSMIGMSTADHICPTCHQEVTSELLPPVQAASMSLEDNIIFLKSQIQMYTSAKVRAQEKQKETTAAHNSIRVKLTDLHSKLRVLRQDVTAPNNNLSRQIIEEIVRSQNFVERLNSIEESVLILSRSLGDVAESWVEIKAEIKSLPKDELSENDNLKINTFELILRRNLKKFGFTSFNVEEIYLSRDNFRPVSLREYDGELISKEINYEISASDGIRLKWAYYQAAIELNSVYKTNHPNFVIYDEPGQQEIESPSLYSFITSSLQNSGSQIIISTSEPLESIYQITQGRGNIIPFSGLIIQPTI